MLPLHRRRCSLPKFVIFVYLFSTTVFADSDFVCRKDYLLVNTLGEHWCFLPRWDTTNSSDEGLDFDEAINICAQEGDWLPILTTNDITQDLSVLGRITWIGLVCNFETNTWEWQDGQQLDFEVFAENHESTCNESNHHYVLDEGVWKPMESDQPVEVVLCARRAVEETSYSSLPAWAIALIVIGALIIFVAGMAALIIARTKIHKMREIEQLESDKHGKHSYHEQRYADFPNRGDEWEIERKCVSIDYTNKLGEGSFGGVFLGRVLAKNLPIGMGRTIAELAALGNNNDTVAIKMLHDDADTLSEREFRAEIDLMKRIGYHERLVNLLGCVTLSEPILLIFEYCSNGDLLEFKRHRRNFMLENPESIDDGNFMTVKKQMMFAIQIAYGMEYLSSRGFIHRDIAARNILVDQQETCKIGDFGLCRAIGKEEDNYQSHGGKLPLKWMSPEAIDTYNFSIASDVWSYGILLFEIITLGGTPYAEWPAAELLSRLKRGERMDRPDTCSEQLFRIMTHCWAELPSERPIFAKLRKRLGVLLEDDNQDDYYLKLNPHANYYLLEK